MYSSPQSTVSGCHSRTRWSGRTTGSPGIQILWPWKGMYGSPLFAGWGGAGGGGGSAGLAICGLGENVESAVAPLGLGKSRRSANPGLTPRAICWRPLRGSNFAPIGAGERAAGRGCSRSPSGRPDRGARRNPGSRPTASSLGWFYRPSGRWDLGRAGRRPQDSEPRGFNGPADFRPPANRSPRPPPRGKIG